MKRIWWTICTIVSLVIISGIILNFSTRPLISSHKAMVTAKEQLRFMGYLPPYKNLGMSTSLEWYNHGRVFGFERVYFTTLNFQPKPGAPIINVEVVEDARTGNLISVLQYNGNPLF